MPGQARILLEREALGGAEDHGSIIVDSTHRSQPCLYP
jgi:hypothetical protein